MIRMIFVFVCVFSLLVPAKASEGLDLPERNAARIDDLEEHVGGLRVDLNRVSRRLDNLCTGPAEKREVVCQADLGELRDRLTRLENTCRLPVAERRGLVCKDELRELEARVNNLGNRLDNLQEIVESRRWSLGAAFGPQVSYLPTTGSIGWLDLDATLTFETAYMGVSLQGGGVMSPNLHNVGGGFNLAPFWKLEGARWLGVGPMIGAEILDFGVRGSYYDERVYGPVLGGLLRFTVIHGDVGAFDITFRGGVKSGVHNIAPAIAGGNGSNGVAVMPFVGLQLEGRLFVQD